jgi:hypothetical protein
MKAHQKFLLVLGILAVVGCTQEASQEGAKEPPVQTEAQPGMQTGAPQGALGTGGATTPQGTQTGAATGTGTGIMTGTPVPNQRDMGTTAGQNVNPNPAATGPASAAPTGR